MMVWELKKDADGVIRQVEEQLSYPVFVKPSSAGSSRGITKAGNRQELLESLQLYYRVFILNDRSALEEEGLAE